MTAVGQILPTFILGPSYFEIGFGRGQFGQLLAVGQGHQRVAFADSLPIAESDPEQDLVVTPPLAWQVAADTTDAEIDISAAEEGGQAWPQWQVRCAERGWTLPVGPVTADAVDDPCQVIEIGGLQAKILVW